MSPNNNVVIIENVLQDYEVISLADLADNPKLFCKVFNKIFSLMIETIMSGSEEEIPTPILVIIKNDLFKLTKMLFKCYGTDQLISTLYPLKDLNGVVDAARREIISAIDKKKASSIERSEKIQNCRDKLFIAIEMMKEFEARRI